MRTVCWFSAGAASAIATKLMLCDDPDAIIAYCETGAEHPDNERFVADCVRWFAVSSRLNSIAWRGFRASWTCGYAGSRTSVSSSTRYRTTGQ